MDLEKTCPKCREKVKLLASLCKHCGYEFSTKEMAEARQKQSTSDQGWGVGCLALIAVVLAVSFCSKSDDPKNAGSTKSTAEVQDAPETVINKNPYADTSKQYAWIAAGEDQIKSQLKDPDSAQFRNSHFYSGGGIPVACGEVNARNGFGGYTGFERFVAAGSTLAVTESQVEGGISEVWDKYCVKGAGDEA